MHEFAIVENMMRIVEKEASANKLYRVDKVKVVVGELTGVVPEILRSCWQAAAEDTLWQEALVELERIPAVAVCRSCAAEFGFTDSFICPHCGGGVDHILSGKELYIEYIEGE